MASILGCEPGGARDWELAPIDAVSLDSLVERLVIPRLLVSHPTPVTVEPGPARDADSACVTADQVEHFARLAVSHEAHALLDAAKAHLERGLAAESLFVDLLAPAARVLGRGWEDDSLDFVEVTMGLWRLQEVLREIAARSPPLPHSDRRDQRSALFAPMPGEQHSFGTAMVAECFERAGWHAELLIESPRSELLQHVAKGAYDLVGLTVSCDCHIDALRTLIAAIRSVSCSPRLRIMVGGRVPALNPGLCTFVGADATADSAVEAVAVADRLVEVSRRASLF